MIFDLMVVGEGVGTSSWVIKGALERPEHGAERSPWDAGFARSTLLLGPLCLLLIL